MSLTKIKSLRLTRGHIRKSVTEIHNDVCEHIEDFDRLKILKYISKLKLHMQNLKDSNDEICHLLFESESDEGASTNSQTKELEAINSYDDKITEALSILEDRVCSVSVGGATPSRDYSDRLKPHKVPLPEFSGAKGESLEKFFTNLESVLSKYQYSNYEKFLLLLQCLSGRARAIVDSLESTKQSYSEAKLLLTESLANPITQKFETLQSLIDMKLTLTKDPYVFIGEFRKLKDSVLNLKIDIETVLQFLLWRSLNDTMREQLINITNCNKPLLKDIETSIFSAIERYSVALKKFERRSDLSNRAKQSSYAASINVPVTETRVSAQSSAKICSLCSGNHAHYVCTKYNSALQKINRLKEIGGCTKCGYSNHKFSQCKMLNLKCKYCSGPHFPCLCKSHDEKLTCYAQPNEKPKQNSNRKSTEKITTSVASISGVFSSICNKNYALPTFTCKVNGTILRAMKDTGASMSLITKDFANKNKLKIIESNVSLTINGFNGPKDYRTSIVEVPMLMCTTNKTFTVNAICVPKIDVNLSLPHMGQVVYEVQSRGYVLADAMLTGDTDSISNIDMILGSDASFCIPCHTEVIGEENPSTLLHSPEGIMFEGKLENLLFNCDYLFPFQRPVIGDLSDKVSASNVEYSDVTLFQFSSSVKSKHFSESVIADEIAAANISSLQRHCNNLLNYDLITVNEETVELNNKLAEFALNNAVRLNDGRLQFPLMWNETVSHLLGSNFNLAFKILNSNYKKLSKTENLILTDNVFKEQVEAGIIEKIHDFDKFKCEHPLYSFLPHMSVIRPSKESTKCRVVYLSNLCEADKHKPRTVCHNQAIYSGPNLNKKLTTSLTLLRFDKHLIIFDLMKAFLQIALPEVDQSRLLLLWYRDVTKADFTLQYYKAKRLPFGIPCSPSILMLAIYKLLILDPKDNHEYLRNLVYTLFYMDNGAYTCDNSNDLKFAKNFLIHLFSQYKFPLQQFVTSCNNLQTELDEEYNIVTPEVVNLLGLQWNRITDTLYSKPLRLDENANTTRKVLKSVAENFDPYNFQGPLLNRAKLFLHELQCNKLYQWDTILPKAVLKEWGNICRQVNSIPIIYVPRFVGNRADRYNLICFADASKLMYGVVVYPQNVESKKVTFVLAKSRVVNTQLAKKSVPTLELNSIVLGTETLIELYEDLTNSDLLCPVRIESLAMYTDSMVSLNWISNVCDKLDKCQNKLSIFVRNRLSHIENLCAKHEVHFKFVAGSENPADEISRAVSYKCLIKSNYFAGPQFLVEGTNTPNILNVVIPSPSFNVSHCVPANDKMDSVKITKAIPLLNYSSFTKLVRVYKLVLEFVNKLKEKIKSSSSNPKSSKPLCFHSAKCHLLRLDQLEHFPQCVEYFKHSSARASDMPNLVKQLNIFPDNLGILRVRCKFGKDFGIRRKEPILLSQHSNLTKLIIEDIHSRMNHSGKYVVLTELRREYYVPKIFSCVKKVLKNCLMCCRFHSKPVVLNQSPYRDCRVNPSTIPFRDVYIDHFGPYNVKFSGQSKKVYVLIFSCMFSRAVDLHLCYDAGVDSFLRAFQMHVYKYGMCERVFSDSGTTLIAGGNVISDYLKDYITKAYLDEYGIRNVSFENYYKGNPALGGLVESLVKLCKRLIYGSIRNNVIPYEDFQLLLSEVNCLANKRPVVLHEALRDDANQEVPSPITPEMIIHGYELPILNCIPALQTPEDGGEDWTPGGIRDNFVKLSKIRKTLLELYREEFLCSLVGSAVDKKDRYITKTHPTLTIGDIVLLKEPCTKPSRYPLAIIKDVQTNVLGEVTGATLKKGSTNEIVQRHSRALIPLLQLANKECTESTPVEPHTERAPPIKRRAAAVTAAQKIKALHN